MKIESFDVNGYGVAKYDNKVVFVMGAMEGEEVIAKVVNVHKKYAFAEVVTILTKSKDRVEPKCPYYEYCGGCDMMHMTYACETKIKHNKVAQTLKSVIRRDFDVSNVIINDQANDPFKKWKSQINSGLSMLTTRKKEASIAQDFLSEELLELVFSPTPESLTVAFTAPKFSTKLPFFS